LKEDDDDDDDGDDDIEVIGDRLSLYWQICCNILILTLVTMD